MNLENLATNISIAALIVLVGYRIALLLIKNWRDTERERTIALAEGFANLVGKVDAHHTADIQSHADLGAHLAAIETALWQRRGTPVHGIRPIRAATNTDKGK
jgi:hypothetical protein